MKILLATDGSEFSEAGAGFLRRLGIGPGDEVFVLHVVKDYLIPDEIDAARDFRAVGQRAATRLVKEFSQRNFPKSPWVKTIVREGEPWQEIIICAEELGADLVVLGHRGLSGIKRFLLGSVVHKVVSNSAVSVLVVRDTPVQDRPFRVMFCTDGTESSDTARDFLMKLPLPPGAELTIVSVVDMEVTSLPEAYYPEEDTSKMMAELREYYEHAAAAALDSDARVLARHFGRISRMSLFGVPDHEIINAATESEADLVVMGCRELKSLKGALLGSASHRVLKHIGCSMLIARKEKC